ncbi:hypothetical protein DPX16_11386 [Anabarilius grahami]|uniref:Uncharacterized protein n=1 Tax=Anabarilius grahami TaxID=495550 RepID=A0A3N0XIJ9_ANAGA|nr:hypothetical protein DPX16_11386 [Anabarilius grahami]
MAELDRFPGHRMEDGGARKRGGILRPCPKWHPKPSRSSSESALSRRNAALTAGYRRGGGVIRRQRHRKRARMCEISQRTESLRDSGLMAAINSGTYISSALTAKPV